MLSFPPSVGQTVRVLFALFLATPLLLASPGHAQDVIVNDSPDSAPSACTGTPDESTVRAGIQAAPSGGTVFVCPGLYTEADTIDKALTLEGNNVGVPGNSPRNAETIIRGGASDTTITLLTTSAVTIDGLELRGNVGIARGGGGASHGHIQIRNTRLRTDEFGITLRGIEADGGITLADNYVDLTANTDPSDRPTTGIDLRTIDGLGSVQVSNTVIQDGPDSGSSAGWYGIVFDGVKPAASAASISGGSIQDVAQGIAVLDGENGSRLTSSDGSQQPDESQFEISGVRMSSFTGSIANAAVDFHAGIFVTSGGSPGTPTTSVGTITDVVVTGTGTAGGDGKSSAGLYFGGFSTEFGDGNFGQSVTATDVTVQDNNNRGVYARGADVDVTVAQSRIVRNGSTPVGSGSNDGFGVIARKGAVLTVTQSEIRNPITSTDFGSTLHAAGTVNGTLPVLTVRNCVIDRNGLGSFFSGGEVVDASGNAWVDGTLITSAATLSGLTTGSKNDYSPFLNSASDSDGSMAGFQGDFSTLLLDSGSYHHQSDTRIEEALALGATTELRLQSTGGTYVLPGASGTQPGGTPLILESNATVTDNGLTNGEIRATRTVQAGETEAFGNLGVTVAPDAGSTDPGSVTVTRVDGQPVMQGTGSITRYYDIDAATSSGLDVDLGLEYDDGTVGDNELSTTATSDEGTLAVFRSTDSGQSWSELTEAQDQDLSGNRITVRDLSSLSRFTLAEQGTKIPVELTRFSGVAVEDGIRLMWRTASEQNNAGFRIQRTRGNRVWRDVGFVEGAGTTSDPQRYRFTDGKLPYPADTLAYRLKQVDVDGTADFTDPIWVGRRGPDELQLRPPAPNPARGRATVPFAVPQHARGERVIVRLYDVMGRTVRTVETEARSGRHVLPLNVSDLRSGTYFVRLRVGSQRRTRKLTVVH